MTTIMQHAANSSDVPLEGTRRSIYLAAQPSPDEQPSDTAVQAMQWDDEPATVHVYVNDGLTLQLTPSEARTLAAMLSLSAGEIDGAGPSAPAVLRAA